MYLSPRPFSRVYFRMKYSMSGGISFPVLAKGRHHDGQDVQPVVQVLPVASLGDRVLQVAVGGRDHPDIDMQRFRAAEPFEPAFLQHAQQLDLDGPADLADLVQKDRSAGRPLEIPLARRAQCAGIRPLFGPEEFAFQQAFGNGSATHIHERVFLPVASCVDRPGDQALARTAFTEQQDGGIGPGDLLHAVEDVPDLGAFADDVRVGDGRRSGRCIRTPPVLLLLQRAFYGGEQLLQLHRLGQIGKGAVAHGLDGRLHGGEGRHHDDTRFRRSAGHALDQVQAVDPGHFHVREQDVELAVTGRFIGLFPVRHPRDFVPLAR